MDACGRRTRAMVEAGGRLDVSLVELVIAASEFSEDEAEIDDLVHDLLESGRIRLSGESVVM